MIPAPSLLAGYLLLGLAPLLASRHGPAGLGVAALHAGAAAVLLARAARRPATLDAWAWLPLLLVPFLYAELPLLNQWAGGGYYDAMVQAWEARLFPSDPSSTLAGSLPWTGLSEILHLGYLSYYPLIYAPFIALHLLGKAEGFHRTALAVLSAFVGCYLVFIVFPVQGPRYLNPVPPGIPGGPFRSLALGVLESASSRGAAFPSSHVAVAVTQAVMLGRTLGRGVGWGVGGLSVALALGAVYGGFHYGVDALAGAAVALGACWLAVRLPARAWGWDAQGVGR